MKLNVKLYGTFRKYFPQYQTSTGIEIKVSEGTLAKDLLAGLEIPENQGAVVIMNGRIIKKEDKIPCGGQVHIIQSIHGG
jgi:sulfur carrier protein ThiS